MSPKSRVRPPPRARISVRAWFKETDLRSVGVYTSWVQIPSDAEPRLIRCVYVCVLLTSFNRLDSVAQLDSAPAF